MNECDAATVVAVWKELQFLQASAFHLVVHLDQFSMMPTV